MINEVDQKQLLSVARQALEARVPAVAPGRRLPQDRSRCAAARS